MQKNELIQTSKYIKAIKEINQPCSPQQIREQLQIQTGIIHTPQQVAMSLYQLRLRESVIKLDNGLYIIPVTAKKE